MSYHKQMSYLKSGFRIVGYIGLLINFRSAVAALVIAEIIGILEEGKEK
jgi:hypothetical protein